MKYSLFFNMKPWYTSKTVWVAVAQAVVGILAAVAAADPNLRVAGVVAVIKSISDILLRLGTFEPLS